MKKILALLAATAIFATGAFALTNEADVSFSIPMSYSSTSTTTTLFGSNITTVVSPYTTSFGLDIADTAWITKKIGAKANLGFYWPSTTETKTKTTTSSGTTTNTSTFKYDDGASYFNFNAFAGVAFKAYSSQILTLTVVPGLNFDVFNAKKDDTSSTTFLMGAGVDIAAKAYVTSKAYLSLSCPLVYEFVRKQNKETDDNFKGRFLYTPKIGLGYRF